MVIKDIFLLERSQDFYVGPSEEVSINLSLVKAPKRPNTKLTGQVFNPHHCPIPHATVIVLDICRNPIQHTLTDERGCFAFIDILPPGKYILFATAEDFKVSKEYRILVVPGCQNKINLLLFPSAQNKFGTVYGIVYDNNSMPLSNVEVILNRCNPQKPVTAITHTNEDGEYLVSSLPPGYYTLWAKKSGYILPEAPQLMVSSNEITPLNVILYEDVSHVKSTISGQIQHKGKPVPEALVGLYAVKENHHILMKLKESNNEGDYLFGEVPPGKYLIKSKKAQKDIELR